MKAILKLFLAWRLWLCIPLLIGGAHLSPRLGMEYTRVAAQRPSAGFILDHLVLSLGNFDGVHYLTIAGEGYSSQARFLPLLPLVISVTSSLLGGPATFSTIQIIVSVLLTSIFFLTALMLFHKLLRLDYSHSVSMSTLKNFILFPTSFFFITVYPEGLFLLLSLGSLYAARRQSWGFASLLGALATIARLQGILILPTLLFEWWWQHRDASQENKPHKKSLLWLSLIPIPFILYAYFNLQKWGSWFYFVTAHTELGNSRVVTQPVFILQTVFRYFKILTTLSPSVYEWWVAGLELASLGVVAWLLYVAFKKKIRPSYLFFSVAMLALPAVSGTLSGFPRYACVSFPMYIALAHVPERWQKTYRVFSSVLQCVLLVLFARGFFIA